MITLSYTTLLLSFLTLPLLPLDKDCSQIFGWLGELFLPELFCLELDSPFEQAIEQYISPLRGKNG